MYYQSTIRRLRVNFIRRRVLAKVGREIQSSLKDEQDFAMQKRGVAFLAKTNENSLSKLPERG